MPRYLRYTVYECSDAGGGGCTELWTYIDGARALARAISIARRGRVAEIEVYEDRGGGGGQ